MCLQRTRPAPRAEQPRPNPLPETLRTMLSELQSGRLEVFKYPVGNPDEPGGGYLRGVASVNCEWYQRLCGNHLRSRRRYPKPRTIIRRQTTEAALRRMIRGNLNGVYAERILDVARYFEYPGA